MKSKAFLRVVGALLALMVFAFGFSGCSGAEKNITVVARTQGSGTREAFDKVVTDGEGNYLEMKIDGTKQFFTTSSADVQQETGNVMSKVASDENAIGYISLGSVNDTVKVVSVNGVKPSAATVLDGSYSIQRPFVVMTSSKVEITPLAADFLSYLSCGEIESIASQSGCIFLSDSEKRANEGESEIAVTDFVKQATIPEGDKIVVRGSSSMEKFIKKAMSAYASFYGKTADEIFTLSLPGSSEGRKAVQDDQTGNVIGLSSAAVKEEGINSFNICLDAVAVVVNTSNDKVDALTLKQLYDIFSGKITKFSELNG